jgi:molybdopterin synthase sulfur carrier subunit
MAALRLFAGARVAAGVSHDTIEAATVGELLDIAVARYGPEFAAILAASKVWLNGSPGELADPVGATDEVAVLPPVSGG